MVGLGLGLAACSNGASIALARQACSHVSTSLKLYKQSQQEPDPAKASSLQEEAYVQLRTALPIAAEAANDNGQWQALMTTLSETNRVPEGTLITALQAQCQVAEQPNPLNPTAPNTPSPPSTTGGDIPPPQQGR